MRIITTVGGMKEHSAGLREKDERIGFVPTMGFLHEGHISLLDRARKENDVLVVSIFVNPTQFGPGEDFESYPRDMERDTALCGEAGTDILFCPSVQGMYPARARTKVSVSGLTEGLCGASRPGHFDGVCTVVAKLLNIVNPHRAYFGLKDYQQFKVICRMADNLNMDTEIIGLPTVREPDGLAMSSRNSYLTPDQRKSALVLSQSLEYAKRMVAKGIRKASAIEEEVKEMIRSKPFTAIDYVSVVDTEELTPLDVIEKRALLALSVTIGRARLIDNAVLETDKGKDGLERS